jgi:hypothetical protein
MSNAASSVSGRGVGDFDVDGVFVGPAPDEPSSSAFLLTALDDDDFGAKKDVIIVNRTIGVE